MAALCASRFTRKSMYQSAESRNFATDGSWIWINCRLPMTSSRRGSNVNGKERRSLFTPASTRSYG